MFKSHLKRILNNPIKFSILILVILFPSMEIFQLMQQLDGIELTRSIYTLFFLAGSGRGHLFQVIYLWLLPLYLLLIIGDDSCIDEKIGYKYVLMGRVGKNKYLYEKWISSFILAGIIMIVSLVCNMFLVSLFFTGRCSDIYLAENMEGTTLERIYTEFPLLSYMGFVLIASIMSGFLGMLGAVVSTTFRNKKYSYAIVFLMWLIFIVMDDSVMLVFQPYIEYSLNIMIRIIVKFVLVCFLCLMGAILYEKKRIYE